MSQEFSPLTTNRAHHPDNELAADDLVVEAVDLRISRDTFQAATFAETETSRNTLTRKETSTKKKRVDTTPRQVSAPNRPKAQP